MRSESKWKWIAIGLILLIGIIHLFEAPDQFGDARYKGVLFLLAAAGGALAAAGIWRGVPYCWLLATLVAAGTLIGYLWSRTVGLPGLPVDHNYFEPPGVVSVIAEVCFLVLAAWQTLSERGRAPSGTVRPA